MAMTMGAGSSVRHDINITPLVDVVLVLLIIFMVVTPMSQSGYDVQVPPAARRGPSPDQIVVRIDAGRQTFLNKESIPYSDFGYRLQSALTHRPGTVVFFAADGSLDYSVVADFMDLCRDHGAHNLGIVFDDL
jgi:biopolymer transport protein ExbD